MSRRRRITASIFSGLVSTAVIVLLLALVDQSRAEIAVLAALWFVFWFLFVVSGLFTRIARHFANPS